MICEKHKCDIETIGSGSMMMKFCPECAKEIPVDEIDKAKKKAKTQEEINKALDNAMLAPRFREKTLANYIAISPGQKNALSSAQWFIENWKQSAGMILIGKTGTGKNHIAAGIVNAMVAQGCSALCTEPIKIVRAIKESWRKDNDQTESEVMKLFLKPDLLVIDEIGVQFGSDTERMYLTEIINDRYNAIRPTIVCGNVTISELEQTIGMRAVDRLRDGGKVVVFDWESYRGKK